ncbi:hypothetical protein FJT64_012666 [Amphibalanus amphitrite]|uniref:G-protein coupled receptors family 1 profile domain-containing protein n=1 Tax=Amphibalanus amphitrite TaxID=1232801 RepID=A0A6A4V2W3_AMPAM|nr:hypothetical protein FJT64_012666 [Amphibalanus amphitrite]
MNATVDNCVLQMPQLRCQRLAVSTAAGANTSRLVCAASDGQERATDMYAALVALSVLIVPAAALLNLAVVVTVYMNRRLHTVINVLVTVLCMNNVMWTGIPIILVSFPNLRHPVACNSFLFIFVVSSRCGLLHLTCREPAGAAGERPRPRASRRRVDIVAGASLAGCLLLFLAAFIPVLFIASVMAGTPCAILPWRRLVTMVSIVLGSGGAAVFSAVLLVVFSRDFRQAFVRTCRAAAGAVGVSSEYATRNSEQRQTGNDSGHRQTGDESRH